MSTRTLRVTNPRKVDDMSSRISHIEFSRSRQLLMPAARSLLFAVLLWLAASAGAIAVPGTPVPITLQTFVLMLAAVTLDWREVAGAIAAYLAAGALGLPVFAGGASTMALVGPSAGFLIGFLPGAVVTALLRGTAHRSGFAGYAWTATRYFLACITGCVLVVYGFGFLVQSALTGVPLTAVALPSMVFVAGDLVKAGVVSLAAAGLVRLR